MTLRILLIAEACNPSWVSVPLVGWSHSQAIGQVEDLETTLVTQIRNREALQSAGLVEGRDFFTIDSEKFEAPAHKIATLLRRGNTKSWTIQTAIRSLVYPYFERCVWKQFGGQIREGKYDIVHRLTPLSPAIPSSLAKKCSQAGVPFILGPLNGGVPWPNGFDATRREEGEWLSRFREGHKLLPGYYRTRKYSAAIIVGSRITWQQVPSKYHHKCVYIPENAIDPQRFRLRRIRQTKVPIRMVFVGRLVPLKGVDLLLKAAAPLIRDRKLELAIIGDGPSNTEIQSIINSEGIRPGVQILGQVPHESIESYLVDADLLVFPSIREFGGAVALEAMAVGLVPLVVRYGGLAELVTDDTGFLVDLGSRAQVIQNIRLQLQELVQNPSSIDSKSDAAAQRVKTLFTWEAKAMQVREVYRWVLGHRTGKPCWGMPLTSPMR